MLDPPFLFNPQFLILPNPRSCVHGVVVLRMRQGSSVISAIASQPIQHALGAVSGWTCSLRAGGLPKEHPSFWRSSSDISQQPRGNVTAGTVLIQGKFNTRSMNGNYSCLPTYSESRKLPRISMKDNDTHASSPHTFSLHFLHFLCLPFPALLGDGGVFDGFMASPERGGSLQSGSRVGSRRQKDASSLVRRRKLLLTPKGILEICAWFTRVLYSSVGFSTVL